MCTYFWKNNPLLSVSRQQPNKHQQPTMHPSKSGSTFPLCGRAASPSVWLTFCHPRWSPQWWSVSIEKAALLLCIRQNVTRNHSNHSVSEASLPLDSSAGMCSLWWHTGLALRCRAEKSFFFRPFFSLRCVVFFSVPPSLKTAADKMDNLYNSAVVNVLSLHIAK